MWMLTRDENTCQELGRANKWDAERSGRQALRASCFPSLDNQIYKNQHSRKARGKYRYILSCRIEHTSNFLSIKFKKLLRRRNV